MNAVQELPTAKAKAVTVTVNEKPVEFQQKKANGAEIKAAAIAQGVAIQPDFSLFAVKGHGKLVQVGDNEEVTLNDHDKFVAVAPDDNS
ncbi:MAG: hypothetical protein C0467_29685 [Planctomycetaceae bacterium]|nr:hypothetical protein [Planctomycetaceae bacterium]